MNAAPQRTPTYSSGSALDWRNERASWPNADTSSFYQAGGLCWHVQQMGEGPQILLIHGTGASTHSWRGLAPLLAQRYTVIAPDLPGHAFTERPRRRLSLGFMAKALAALVEAMPLRPTLVAGHSAGAAILLRCCLDGALSPSGVVSINGALLPFRGAAGFLFPPLARLMFLNPLTPRLLARSAGNRERVERLIRDTGSELDSTGIDFYARLFRNPAQISAALGMMAHWDLRRLASGSDALDLPLLLLAGENDRAIAPDEADRVAKMVSGSCVQRMPDLGHLAHEEDAAAVAARVLKFADEIGA